MHTNSKVPPLDSLTIGGYTLDLGYFLGSDFEDISIVCEELPAAIEWVNQNLQSMLESKGVQDQKIKQEEAKAYFFIKSGGFEQRGYSGRCTEEAVKHAIQLESSVIDAHERYAVLDGWCKRLYNLQESMNAKMQLIRSSEATRRKVFSPEHE